MFLPTRRTFLHTVAAALGLLCLPRRSFWFLHAPTGESWQVDDPVAWALENANQPILERARERLATLDASQPHRAIRVVVRRCKLNLVELRAGQVVVHHWGRMGLADLRPFFKEHGLTRKEVLLLDRKGEQRTLRHGDEFMYGERLELPVEVYEKKWRRRWVEEADDGLGAPGTSSGFGWKGIEPTGIPWAALKSVWRRTTSMACLNCDEPTILTNFGQRQCGMSNREARFFHACGRCGRLFQDHSISRWKVGEWIVANLDAKFWPDFIVWMGRAGEWKPPEP